MTRLWSGVTSTAWTMVSAVGAQPSSAPVFGSKAARCPRGWLLAIEKLPPT